MLHGKVEEVLHEAAGASEPSFVVTRVQDEKKGEHLVVLHKLSEESLHCCLEAPARSDIPNLWKPRAEHSIRVDDFPFLGSGKFDLRRIQETAEKASAAGDEDKDGVR